MMKRTITCLLLVLALLCGIAQAEEAVTYTPGAITEALFGEAFDSGKLVMADLSLDLDLAPELLEGEDGAGAEFGHTTLISGGVSTFNSMRIVNLFPLIFLIPIGTIVTRRFYKETGSIYAGSFTIAMLYTMMTVANTMFLASVLG